MTKFSEKKDGNNANIMLATADQLIKEIDLLLENTAFVRKDANDEYSPIVGRAKINQLRNEYVRLRKGGC